MNNWIVEPELVACAVIALLLCFSREKRLAPTLQSRIYLNCTQKVRQRYDQAAKRACCL